MKKQFITLPNGRRCGLGTYTAAWRTLLATDRDQRVAGFDHFPESAGAILRELRRGMHDRINHHIADHGIGRKWSHDWQRHALQCAIAVNTPRLVVRWVPADFRARLAHRLSAD
jgi:hypothetical protein